MNGLSKGIHKVSAFCLMEDIYLRKKGNRKKEFFPKTSEKIGLLKRFLAWIARGAVESYTGGAHCPT